MPLTLRRLVTDRAEIRVPMNGKPLDQCNADEIVTLVYRPSAFNLVNEQDNQALRLAGEPAVKRMATNLHALLVGWDVIEEIPKVDSDGHPVLDESGQPLYETTADGAVKTRLCPLTVENLGSLGFARLNQWHDAVWADLIADPQTGISSPNGSVPAAS